MKLLAGCLLVASLAASTLDAQDIRSRIRLSPRGTRITQAQAEELTLTVTEVTTRDIQTWVRAAGTLDRAGKVVTAFLSGPDAMLVQAGQRARTFPVESRFSMNQARVVRAAPQGSRVRVDVEIQSVGRTATPDYVVEIVAERGDFLSVPNEAIIEEGDSQVVYVQTDSGQYEPQTIRTGIQGELYTQVLDGVKQGDQVVTFGSFFIDSEFKLKGATTVGNPP